MRKACVVLSAIVAFATFTTVQAIAAETGASSTMTEKQARKAERKAARSRNRAEVKKLEQQGFDPTDGEAGYPENLQRAEQKRDASDAGARQGGKALPAK